MHTVPLGPTRTRLSLLMGLVLAVAMIVVGLVTIAVAGPPWFAAAMLVVGALVAGLAIVRLALLRRR